MRPLARTLAEQLLRHAEQVMPPPRRPWVRAMRAELDHLPDGSPLIGFALGGVWASYAQGIDDVLTFARLSRWTLAGLAAAWAGFLVLAAAMVLLVKSSPRLTPADLGVDAGTDLTLRFIQAYPAWEAGLIAVLAGVMAAGAVDLVRRRPRALTLLGLGVGAALLLALYDLRLPDPGGDRPLQSPMAMLAPLLCLVPIWWLSRRASDL